MGLSQFSSDRKLNPTFLTSTFCKLVFLQLFVFSNQKIAHPKWVMVFVLRAFCFAKLSAKQTKKPYVNTVYIVLS